MTSLKPRRSFRALVALTLASMATAPTPTPPTSPVAADALVPDPAALQKVATGFGFVEGPTWLPDRHAFVFSDIPRDTQHLISLRPDGTFGEPEIFRQPSRNANGTTLDPQGRLLICRHGARDLVRLAADGTEEILATHYQGKRLNSPNDVIVAPDGAIYFTDPPWGLGRNDVRELDHASVYRLAPDGTLTAIASDMLAPNGLALSPDGKILYVAESWWQLKPQFISAYPVRPDGSLGEPTRFHDVEKGTPDGMRVDRDGNVWTTSGDAILVLSPQGRLLTRIPVPETPANLTFGGPDGQTLLITAKTSIYAIRVGTTANGFRRVKIQP